MCHKCGEKRDAQETCVTCGSWNLTPLGIGVDAVYEELVKKITDNYGENTGKNASNGTEENVEKIKETIGKIFRIDADSTKTAKAAKKAVAQFYAEPGSILIGTEMMLSFLHEPVDFSVVVTLDSLFSIPDYRMGEKIMHLISALRGITTSSLIVQTRKPDEQVLDFATKGNLSQYYDLEISLRKDLHQPPFFTHIKVTIEGQKKVISDVMHSIQNSVEKISTETQLGFELEVFPAFIHTLKGKSVLHGLIRLKRNTWPHAELAKFLQSLPPNVTVKVNPDSLL